MHGEDGQATVEWVALALLAALVLGAAAALGSPAADGSLGELMAKRIARAPGELGRGEGGPGPARDRLAPAQPGAASPAAANAPAARPSAPEQSAAAQPAPAGAPAPRPSAPAGAPAPHPSGPRPLAASASVPASRALEPFPQLRGLGQVARHSWVVCLGYRRWRHELTHPRAPTEPLPIGDALAIVNDCLNPYDYLLAD